MSDSGSEYGLTWSETENSKQTLSYDKFVLDPAAGSVQFYYSLRDASTDQELLSFGSVVALDCLKERELNQGAEAACMAIGMVLVQWYWMGFYCETVEVRAGYLDDEQLQFWSAFYEEVTGEFFMENNLEWLCPEVACLCDPSQAFPAADSLYTHTSQPAATHPCNPVNTNLSCTTGSSDSCWLGPGRRPHVLVPLGAGKDSLTLFEMLKPSGAELRWFFLGGFIDEFSKLWRYAAVVREAGGGAALNIGHHDLDHDNKWEAGRRRSLSPVAHSWAALVAMTSALVAVQEGCEYVAVGNERSANYGNGSWRGRPFNHQYDKSMDFELLVAAYIKKHICSEIHYFSGLAHLWEIQIAQRFCEKCPGLLPLFLSCNEPAGARWCGCCAKCLFVALMMAAFLPPPQVAGIFGDLPLETPALLPLLLALTAAEGTHKPLECVGTPQETCLAARLAVQRCDQHWPGYTPQLLKLWLECDVGRAAPDEDARYLLTDCGDMSNIPGIFLRYLL